MKNGKTRNSEFGKLKTKDFWKGLIMSVGSAALTAIATALGLASKFNEVNFQMVALTSGAVFVTYITKNILTNSDGEILKSES